MGGVYICEGGRKALQPGETQRTLVKFIVFYKGYFLCILSSFSLCKSYRISLLGGLQMPVLVHEGTMEAHEFKSNNGS
jgi:hypothetical protein